MKIWFTSDYHLGHENIIKYCDRPFKDINKMNETIIRNHNERVKPNDIVFFLGDFCFKNTSGGKEGEGQQITAESWLNQLNGNFVFIKGNHDKNNSLKAIIDFIVITLGGKDIYLCHNPQDFNYKYKINFVGHIHNKWKIKKEDKTRVLLINVGCDVWNFRPIDINEIMRRIVKFEKSE